MYFLPYFDLFNYSLFYHNVCVNAKKIENDFVCILTSEKKKNILKIG